jgi:hypothetical protein
MPKFGSSVPHTFGKEKAKESLKNGLTRAKEMGVEQLKNMTEDWSKWDSDGVLGFQLSTSGIKISGTMTVTDDAVQIAGDIPFAAMMFKGKIEEKFKELVSKVLH